ncbi:drebrin-like protein [Geosmithia morbida]|uniref:Drebrin-like protein n=1 Tax=Geosmithia morbida TaxID=1094350 RepID=A0A9P5D0B7_9HYPO|nr:drebrin-like protein [Geosmithia morbida]KAF4122568.1 drebrin-like protein [Geosmithia morbida]
MASINLSLNGAAIKNSYKKVLEGALPAGSPTSCLWALFSVQAPLVNAFQNSGSSESVLKVQDSGEGELSDLFEEFNDGRIQYAYIKLNDPNKNIPKRVLIAWCGSGVPERTKGYFNNYTNAITGVLQGFHTQITARSDDDLDAQAILSKVVAASGSDYSGPGVKAATSSRAPPPRTVAAKPVFTPTTSTATRSNLVASRSTRNVDDNDGWGDAPPVTRTQPEKVESAYKPTKVNMAELTKQKAEPSRFVPTARRDDGGADVVKGGYQPIGKVDIAAIRAQAKKDQDDRPTPVKGAYEPVGKVDIAAIRAKAQKPTSAPQAEEESQAPKGVSDRASAFSQPAQSERLTSLPKPKVANKFGGATAFTGTKPPVPVGGASAPAPAPVGSASRTFADQGGKTPAQLWAEKKAKERGEPVPSASAPSSAPVESQKTGGEEWKSGYAGKSWAPVQTSSRFSRPEDGQEAVDVPQHEEQQPTHTGSGSVSALKDRFKGAAPMGVGAAAGVVAGAGASAAIASHEKEEEEESAPPPVPDASRPAGGFSLPGLPSRPAAPVEEPRQEEEEYEPEPESPVRIAIPVARSPSPEETRAPPPPPPAEPEPAPVPEAAAPVADQKEGGFVAVVQFDYEKGEENEVELVEGEYVTDIDMVDEGWWAGTNARGERGLFPCNYVELVEDGGTVPHHEEPEPAPPSPARQEAAAPPPPAPAAAPPASVGPTATAIYDYEAGENNELSFPEDAIITNLKFPDDDWWAGEYNGNIGLFPANYVRLNE